MRWVAALALVLVVLVGATIKLATHGRGRGPAVAPEMPEPPPLTPRPRLDPPRSPPSQSAPRARTGIAHVRGTVRLPRGPSGPDVFEDLEVVADDGTRVFNARLTGGGRFILHLPPGRYDVIASLGELVGRVVAVAAQAGGERDVDIQLAGAAAISGKFLTDRHGHVTIAAKPVDGANTIYGGGSSEGFEIQGLLPGQRYDLSFSGSGIRNTTVREIAAPATDLEVALEPLPTLRGAVGFPRGQRCPITEVSLEARSPQARDYEEHDGTTVQPGADCRFALTVPENVSVAKVVAQGAGWFLEEQVDIPARGDPDPICLNPPCRDNPTEGLARLRITLEGATPESVITADARSSAELSAAHHSCSSQQGWCELADLPVGESFEVDGYGDDCRAETRTILLASGDNSVRLACRRQRRVEGVVHAVDGAVPERVNVRCASGDFRTLRNTRVFELRCGAEDRSVEFQLARGDAWRSVPLPPTTDPAFVEIGR